jgi:hypothetical protein
VVVDDRLLQDFIECGSMGSRGTRCLSLRVLRASTLSPLRTSQSINIGEATADISTVSRSRGARAVVRALGIGSSTLKAEASHFEMRTRDTLVEGKSIPLKSIVVDGQEKEIVITGKLMKTARLAEEWYEDVEAPEAIIEGIKKSGANVDIFTFWQRLPDTIPKHNYHMEMESIAALPVTSVAHWLKNQLNPKTRNLLKKSAKLGVVVKPVDFNDDAFIKGMMDIFNETPIRQDKPFWHYGKDVETIKKEFSRYLFREDLFGAYSNDELIGFIFIADGGKYALLGQIISKIEHRDKSPNNALIAKAVEICEKRHFPYLVYATWSAGSLGHFKRQNGFERVDLPRYYVPLTIKGAIALQLHLHHGVVGIIPARLKSHLVSLRNKWYSRRSLAAS